MNLEAMDNKLKYCYIIEELTNVSVYLCQRDMMFERTIQMMKNKSTFGMEQIAHSHRRSIDIESRKIKKIDIDTWLVHSKTPDKNTYTVSFNNSENCMGCPLACPGCLIINLHVAA
ncbi:SWIM-type domain-containing protein [Aphis craccivora]|uniref:SWIM-type domain-containing protein n=1 Tax=Aphis craccivora TaxID=307492 RepID=A0A6G0YKY9_APHCR|nr:SWIM-type domain-containing protein [Aphis craccivora]